MSSVSSFPTIAPSPWETVDARRTSGFPSVVLPVPSNIESSSRSSRNTTAQPAPFSQIDAKKLLTAAGLLGVGLLLKALPKQGLSKPAILSADWKDYAKVILGVLATRHVNTALNLKPEPWQLGLETSTLIHPLVVNWGNSFFARFVPLGLVVPTVIEIGSRLNAWVGEKAEKRWGVPHWASGLGVSALMMGVGMGLYAIVFKGLGMTGLLGKTLKTEASQAGWTISSMLVCLRGCCQGSAICLTELGEILGSLANWWHGNARTHPTTPYQQTKPPQELAA